MLCLLRIKGAHHLRRGGGGLLQKGGRSAKSLQALLDWKQLKLSTPTPPCFYTDRLPFVIQIFLSSFLLKINDIGFSVSVEPTAIIHTLQEKSWDQMKRKKWKEIEEGRGEMKAEEREGGGGEWYKENNGKN